MLLYLRLFKESFSFAINSLTHEKFRTFLSKLDVVIGVFSVFPVLAAVESLALNIQDPRAGLNFLVIKNNFA